MTIHDLFAAKFSALWVDVETMRKSALRQTPEGARVRDPAMLERAIKFQSELMVLSIETMKEVAALTLTTNFSQAIVDEVGAESPDCALRIMYRLKRLTDEHKASDAAKAPRGAE
jgi:hypothetical protein